MLDGEAFSKDVNQHQLTILHDANTYKHLRFRRGGSNVFWFDLVIFPGGLLITGDMGEYLFKRENDMIGWFLNGRSGLEINPTYWSQKVAACGQTEVKRFSLQKMLDTLKEDALEWAEGEQLTKEETDAFSSRFNQEMFNISQNYLGGNLKEIWPLVEDIEIETPAGTYNILGDPEWSFDDFTTHFIWCCYAIIWGLQKYQKAQVPSIDVS